MQAPPKQQDSHAKQTINSTITQPNSHQAPPSFLDQIRAKKKHTPEKGETLTSTIKYTPEKKPKSSTNPTLKMFTDPKAQNLLSRAQKQQRQAAIKEAQATEQELNNTNSLESGLANIRKGVRGGSDSDSSSSNSSSVDWSP